MARKKISGFATWMGVILLLLVGALIGGVAATLMLDATDEVAKQGKAVLKDIAQKADVKPKKRPGQPKPYYGKLPSVAQLNVRDAALEQLYKGLDYPWAFEFIADDELLITEMRGTLQRFNTTTRTLTEVQGVPAIPGGKSQIGLMDVALHPDFASNGRIYFSHAVDGEEDGTWAVGLTTAILDGDQLREVVRLLVATPFAKSPSNFGGALAFDAKGFLYVATGDRSARDNAQRGQHLTGKVLRLNDDGSVPTDNPFVGDPAVDDRIYALGVRNPQGLYFDSVTAQLLETEHGPMGGDEINVIRAGRNYGWPVITYGANYTTQRIGVGSRAAGYEQPLFYYLPSVAVSPIAVYRGAMFEEWDGDLLVGPLKGRNVNKLDWVDGEIKSEHRMLKEMHGRIRDIKVAADGSVFFLVQKNGRIYRLYRDPATEGADQPKERPGQKIYRLVCASCHAPGLNAYPQLADQDAWRARLQADRAVLLDRVINGYGAMPPKGACDRCTDAELEAALDHMLKTQGGG